MVATRTVEAMDGTITEFRADEHLAHTGRDAARGSSPHMGHMVLNITRIQQLIISFTVIPI